MGMTRILYASDFHGSEAFFRKFLGAALHYKADVLIVGGDVTGKAMIPVIHQGGGRYEAHLFGRKETPSTSEALDKLRQTITNVGFYPIVLEQDEARALEDDPAKMTQRFEQEMMERVRLWLGLAEDTLGPRSIHLYFMPGNDDVFAIDEVIRGYDHVHNPDGQRFWIDDDHELVGVAYANMTPWRCARDVEEDVLAAKLEQAARLLQAPERAIMAVHVPPYDSGLDVCPELDENLQIVHRGGQVLMKAVGSTSVRAVIERVQPLLSLHGHIHEAPGHTRIGRTLCINAGSEYAEGIMKAAIINLERDKVKGHVLISG
ncbi:MAG: metallophosphoesterase [Chloroflexota bacterium]